MSCAQGRPPPPRLPSRLRPARKSLRGMRIASLALRHGIPRVHPFLDHILTLRSLLCISIKCIPRDPIGQGCGILSVKGPDMTKLSLVPNPDCRMQFSGHQCSGNQENGMDDFFFPCICSCVSFCFLDFCKASDSASQAGASCSFVEGDIRCRGRHWDVSFSVYASFCFCFWSTLFSKTHNAALLACLT